MFEPLGDDTFAIKCPFALGGPSYITMDDADQLRGVSSVTSDEQRFKVVYRDGSMPMWMKVTHVTSSGEEPGMYAKFMP